MAVGFAKHHAPFPDLESLVQVLRVSHRMKEPFSIVDRVGTLTVALGQ